MDPLDKGLKNAELAVSYITGLQFDNIPPQTVKMVKCCLMDYLSACIAGIGFPASKSGL